MKSYEKLELVIQLFDAEDIVTASVACVCDTKDFPCVRSVQGNVIHHYCDADEHTGCDIKNAWE